MLHENMLAYYHTLHPLCTRATTVCGYIAWLDYRWRDTAHIIINFFLTHSLAPLSSTMRAPPARHLDLHDELGTINDEGPDGYCAIRLEGKCYI